MSDFLYIKEDLKTFNRIKFRKYEKNENSVGTWHINLVLKRKRVGGNSSVGKEFR